MTDEQSLLHIRLEYLRTKKNLTIEEASLMLGMSSEDLEKLESGEKSLDFNSLINVATIYDVNISTITGNKLDSSCEKIFRLYKVIGDREAKHQVKLYLQALLTKYSFS